MIEIIEATPEILKIRKHLKPINLEAQRHDRIHRRSSCGERARRRSRRAQPRRQMVPLQQRNAVSGNRRRRDRLPRELRLLGGPPQTAQGDLYLVVQVGNAFLHEFPSARVAVNKGRYLAVDLTAERTRRTCCSTAEPASGSARCPQNTTVLETLAPANAERQPDPGIAALVGHGVAGPARPIR